MTASLLLQRLHAAGIDDVVGVDLSAEGMAAEAGLAGPASPPTDLASEVAAAIDRVLGRVPAAASSGTRPDENRFRATEVP